MDPTARLARTMVVAATGLLAVLFASQMYLWINWWPLRIGWTQALAWSIPQLAAWLVMIPVVVSLSRRYPVDRGARAPRIAGHVAASLVFGIAGLAILDVTDRLLHWTSLMGAPELVSRLKYTAIHLHWGTAIYWVVVGADHAVRYHRETRERELRAAHLESALSQSQLSMLRAQLNPHFLFNTLNSIAVLTRHDPARAEGMLHRLSDFLRAAVEEDDTQVTSLAAELDRLRDYLGIEEERFGDRLTIRLTMADDVADAAVPAFLLQPLVENALRHGLSPKPGRVTLDVTAERRGDRTCLTIRDDGVGITAGDLHEGTGLANTRRRLALLYGPDATLRVATRPDGGAESIVELPWSIASA